jgi:hypothetical protein
MADDDDTLTVIDRRDGERRLLDRPEHDRRQGERRDLECRPGDLRADDVVIDLRDGQPTVTIVPDVEVALARRWFLLLILGGLNILDLVSTKLVLEAGGAEANPIMAPIIHHPVAPAVVKAAGFALVAQVLQACPPRSVVVDRALAVVTGVYTAVVAWNLINLLVHT